MKKFSESLREQTVKFEYKYAKGDKLDSQNCQNRYTSEYRGAAYSICTLTLFRIGLFGAAPPP